jgi:hypothetical protein
LSPGDVAGQVLRLWPDVEHHYLAAGKAVRQVRRRDLFDVASFTQVLIRQHGDFGDMPSRDVANRRPQLGHTIARQPIDDTNAVTTRTNEASASKYAEMMGGVCERLADFCGDLVHRPLALREDIDNLGPAAISERVGHRRERVEQRVLCLAVAHILKISLES